jgi:transcription antitermination protein NusB
MIRVTRHQQRIWALQILYSMDVTNELNLKYTWKNILNVKREYNLDEDNYYFEEVVTGVINNFEEYDKIIDHQAIDWHVERLAYIDRNILRIAIYELNNDMPVGVVINEAVELAKEYGDVKSSAFINGILARINEYT